MPPDDPCRRRAARPLGGLAAGHRELSDEGLEVVVGARSDVDCGDDVVGDDVRRRGADLQLTDRRPVVGIRRRRFVRRHHEPGSCHQSIPPAAHRCAAGVGPFAGELEGQAGHRHDLAHGTDGGSPFRERVALLHVQLDVGPGKAVPAARRSVAACRRERGGQPEVRERRSDADAGGVADIELCGIDGAADGTTAEEALAEPASLLVAEGDDGE